MPPKSKLVEARTSAKISWSWILLQFFHCLEISSCVRPAPRTTYNFRLPKLASVFAIKKFWLKFFRFRKYRYVHNIAENFCWSNCLDHCEKLAKSAFISTPCKKQQCNARLSHRFCVALHHFFCSIGLWPLHSSHWDRILWNAFPSILKCQDEFYYKKLKVDFRSKLKPK